MMEKREYKLSWVSMLKAQIKARKFLITNRFKVFTWTDNGKKYLVVAETNWRGTKWRRAFEVISELDESMNPIPFSGKEVIKPCTKQ